MIQTEFYKTRDDGVDLYRSYSDRDMKIQKDGTEQLYDEAIDVENSGYTYTETDIPIEGEEEDEQAQKAAAYDIIVGGVQNEPD
nr:hypothetical protein [uncultured Ruminococcus sp.]